MVMHCMYEIRDRQLRYKPVGCRFHEHLVGWQSLGGTEMIELDFEKQDGLIPAIAQDTKTGEVLMLAYMNEESWALTLESGIAHYWSRSRSKLWKKGESSGNVQKIDEIRIDCDSDTVLLKVEQIGNAACHTGRKSCFFNLVKGDTTEIVGEQFFDPKDVYGETK
jgi:phosphoribosyl-AMP cyclohydrolase